YISQSRQEEEDILKQDLLRELDSILEKRMGRLLEKDTLLTLTMISESEFWSPGIQILSEVNSSSELEKINDDYDEKIYKFSNGVVLKNYLYQNFDVTGSDGVFCIFDARSEEHIDPQWREVLIKIINDLEENKVALIGIRVSEKSDWSQLMEEFNVNELLEEKMVSLLFFKIGVEYRLEIYDQLKVMLSTIKFL
ncbi:MAG: hypothetical protein ACXAES_15220, partial [Promethearchaeota archaeon]